MKVISYMCHHCGAATEPAAIEGGRTMKCDICRLPALGRFVAWDSPEEDSAALEIIERHKSGIKSSYVVWEESPFSTSNKLTSYFRAPFADDVDISQFYGTRSK